MTVFAAFQESVLLTECSDKKAINNHVAWDKVPFFFKKCGKLQFFGKNKKFPNPPSFRLKKACCKLYWGLFFADVSGRHEQRGYKAGQKHC